VSPPAREGHRPGELSDLRPATVEDLLGYEPRVVDAAAARASIAGRSVTVTGAAGSIGAELCRAIIALQPERLDLIDVDEGGLYELYLELEGSAPGVPRMVICDVRDGARLGEVIDAARPNVVFHCAAYRRHAVMASAPEEAARVNVLGTLNLLRASSQFEVERFILVSSTRVASPRNLTDLTRLLAERLVLQWNERERIAAVVVRLGNVLGSRGSVVHVFDSQLRRGAPLTVTDPEATPSFILPGEAARMVLQAQALGADGDVLVVRAGQPVRVLGLAQRMIALSGIAGSVKVIAPRSGEGSDRPLLDTREAPEPSGLDGIDRVSASPLEPDADASLRELIGLAERGDSKALATALRQMEDGRRGDDDGAAGTV
jgi:FlaA1/EpsC-like NDP-sugar epimerase